MARHSAFSGPALAVYGGVALLTCVIVYAAAGRSASAGAVGLLAMLLLATLIRLVWCVLARTRTAIVAYQLHAVALAIGTILGCLLRDPSGWKAWGPAAVILWLICVVIGLLAAIPAFIARTSGGDGPHCPNCGYDVRGLTERRCPECGRRFSRLEVDRMWLQQRESDRPASPSYDRIDERDEGRPDERT